MSFRRLLKEFFKICTSFHAFAVLPYGIKDFRVYLLDICSHILKNKTIFGTHKTLCVRKLLGKNTNQGRKFEPFLDF